MNDKLADGGMIDVRGLSLDKLLTRVDESSLTVALDRIFAPQQEVTHHGFNSSI